MSFWSFFKKRKDSLISASKIRFSYADKEVLKDITLSIKKGNITAIIGTSGSGKSTFLRIVAGIVGGGYYGKIRISGSPIIFKKNKIGFVSQNVSFIPDLSIEDNIKIYGLNYGVSEKKSLERAYDLMKMLKFEENSKKKPSELSGGQRVKLNIILSNLHDPEILILDEPFVGLDFLNRKLLWHFLELMKKKGKSVVLTSHLLSETQEHANRIVILKNGRIFFNGHVDSLKSKLKISFIYEVKLSVISKINWENIEKYCIYNDIKILDRYGGYIMFALENERKKSSLDRLFLKLNLNFDVIGFREPNLDEIFLKA
jgi:ABC-2 type transport system ATP-binding protein